MRLEEICIGDLVRVREWDDMVQEYGLNQYCNIATGAISFKPYMRRFCGRVYRVAAIRRPIIKIVGNDGGNIPDSYLFSFEMLESPDLKELPVISAEALCKVLYQS